MTALSIPVKSTRVMRIFIIVLHLLAMLAIFILTVPEYCKVISMLMLLCHGVWQYYRYHYQFPIVKAGFNPSGFWCETKTQQHWVKILPGSVITRLFISLHVKLIDTNKRFYLILPVWHYAPMEYRAVARKIKTNACH